jgi:hypothetical protein
MAPRQDCWVEAGVGMWHITVERAGEGPHRPRLDCTIFQGGKAWESEALTFEALDLTTMDRSRGRADSFEKARAHDDLNGGKERDLLDLGLDVVRPPENHRIHQRCPAAPWSQRSWVPCRGLQGPGERRPGQGSSPAGRTEGARCMLPLTRSHSHPLIAFRCWVYPRCLITRS